jgi:outer membrane protein assembly factor BamB
MVQGDLRRHGARRASVLIAICIVGTVLATVSAFAGTPAGVHGWQRADLTPVTQPVAIAGRFILYDGSSRRLHVVALDARTGKTAWSRGAGVYRVSPRVAAAGGVWG